VAAFESAVNDYNNLLLKAANEVVSEITRYTSFRRLVYQAEDVAFMKKKYELVYSRYRHGGIDSMISVLRSMKSIYLQKSRC